MDRYAIVQNGVVINVVEYENQPDNPPPGFDEGCVAIKNSNSNTGWRYQDGQFADPNPPQVFEPRQPASLADAILSDPVELAKLKQALGMS